MTRFIRIGLALLVLLAPLAARAQSGEAIDLVRSFYVPGFDEEKMPLSSRLKTLFDAALANSKQHDMPVSGLDFSWILNAQDAEPGFDKTLQFAELKRTPNAATIRVTFRNGRQEELRYEMKREGGKMVVDDIHYVTGQPTSLGKMLVEGANEKP